jgi:hypothetical protein
LKNLGLTYCTNVHALGDWASWQDIIGRFGPAIRSDLGWPNLSMGLWFPAALIAELNLDPEGSRQRIRELLAGKNLSAFTCNAFPFGNFHDKVVKTKVYHPDWTSRERLDYTVACARILSALVPSGGEGSVSTLPLGWRIGWSEGHSRLAARNLCAYAIAARESADKEGRFIRLGIEPEPGCVLETIDQVVTFWDKHLRPAAREAGIPGSELDLFVGLCYDTCHQAVQFEDAVESLARLGANGIRIAKMQLSSALEFKADPARLTAALRENFVEERFLHQTRIKTPDGIISYDDLPQALEAPEELWAHPWRVHFHLPIDAVDLLGSGSIVTTRDEMLKAYAYALAHDLCRHFEVETYTWNVLPEAHRPKDDADLARSIAREIRFISDRTPPGAQ